MEELNELKNLVIQTLEANGQLSNIRAQIRSSVFKIVDEPNTEKKVHLIIARFLLFTGKTLNAKNCSRNKTGRNWSV